MPDWAAMNETDVREAVVRPFIESLGYRHGTQATIRAEVPLRYGKAFLGRKNPAKDPLLGKADYVCDVISYGRWVVEVKAPSKTITQDDIEQAHTYASHPEISALYFLVTNGIDYQLFMVSRLTAPLLRWSYDSLELFRSRVENILGLDAIIKYVRRITPDIGQPLGKGLPSRLRILGGEIIYGQHHSNHPLLHDDVINNTIAPITEGNVTREEDGRISASLRVISVTGAARELNERLGLDRFKFATTASEISKYVQSPTIFNNIQVGSLNEGDLIGNIMGQKNVILPFTISFEVFSEAIGYFDGTEFKGIVSFDYLFEFHPPKINPNPVILKFLESVPKRGNLVGDGVFTVRLAEFDI